MKTDLISTRIEHSVKVEFTKICDDLGLSPSQAIKLFAKAVINHGGIPFELIAKKPNATTLKAMQDVENGRVLKSKNTADLFKKLGVNVKDA